MIMNTASGMMESEDRTVILGGPKDTIASLWTKGLKALVPPNSFGPPTMVAAVFDFKNLGWGSPFYEVISQKIFNFTNDGFP